MSELAPLGRRAVVVGASLAGMLSARAVAPHFEEVVVVERAALGDAPSPRMSAPQSYHLHVLLKGGENAMEELVPGFRDAIRASGSVELHPGQDFHSASELGVARPFETTMRAQGQSRWLLEHCLRERVLAQTDNLDLRCGVTVRALRHDAGANRVQGVEIEVDGVRSELDCDLVVDASGRGEGAVRWFGALGLPVPDIEEVKVDFGYASTVVRLAEDPERTWKGVVCGNLPRAGARGGVLMPIEGGRHICSLGGRAGDYPPDDVEGFIAFTAGLPNQTLHDALRSAEFLAPISRLIYPANRLRHYERMGDALPEGFVPVGDALCSFNPTYGQGMSSSALQARTLAHTLAERAAGEGLRTLVQRHLDAAAEVVRLPWRQANYNDFLYPTTEGDRSMFSEEEMNYRTRVAIAALKDDYVRDLSSAVQNLLVPFERLLEADVRARVDQALAA
ncbi:MAG: FAD-dependent monooxygenase [Pseudomonadales bacterium]|jgi:2-polyprenyl-6-methoxyphenol hydroxylase-like FAD-dependent oxidoreductase|nr:FAD-dependent monooxygenase [Pseudomonadales bacterium]